MKNRQPNLLEFPLNDYGNGQRIIAVHGEQMRFGFGFNKWFIWDGRRWKFDEKEQARKLAQETMLEFNRQALQNRQKDAALFASSVSLNTNRLNAALTEARPHLAVTAGELDQHHSLLNFENGTLDLKTGVLIPHCRDHRITKLIHHKFNSDARCPIFLNFLKKVVGEKFVEYLSKVFGYALTGLTEEKLVFLLHGPTNAGKTTLLTLFQRHLLVEYAAKIQIATLMAHDEDNNTRSDAADLRGSRLAITSEVDEGQRLNVARLKALVQGQGTFKAIRKYENPIEFPETWKLFIDANHRPVIRDTDASIWNRLIVIPFPKSVPEDEIDRDLPKKLLEEAEGILAWAVAGERLRQKEGLRTPHEFLLVRDQYRVEMDRLGAFVTARCVVSETVKSGASALYREYRDWCQETGEHPISQTAFGLRMTERGFGKYEDRRGTIYCGIGIKSDCERVSVN